MHVVRLYDPTRQPPSWTRLIQPGQVAVFSTEIESGVPCTATGEFFPTTDDITCLIFESMSEAESFCRQRVQELPTLRFDVFDSAGRTKPPLLTIVHPSRTARLERRLDTRTGYWIAGLLASVGPLLIWYDWAKHDGILVLPTVVGINFLLIAARLVQLNVTYAVAERARRSRLAKHLEGAG